MLRCIVKEIHFIAGKDKMLMKKIMVCFGTRPEAIKMCPLVKELMSRPEEFETVICVTGQHKEMLDQVLRIFNVQPKYNLSIMEKGQTLFTITQKILSRIEEVLEAEKPDVVLVHGDTSTTFVTALAAFYKQIPVGHVEAGLRTNNIYSPFPEEFNRQAVGIVAKYHFSPTETAKENLVREGKDPTNIFVTGNTAIDALKTTVQADYSSEILDWAADSKLIVLTAHRRENLGGGLERIFEAVNRAVETRDDIKVIYPVHMNPQIVELANRMLKSDRIKLIPPMDVIDFHNILARSYLVLTDSGGIQEEAPALGKPVLVMRDTTERPEGVAAGTLKLVGTDVESIYSAFMELLNSREMYERMASARNPYGDGTASCQIADILAK